MYYFSLFPAPKRKLGVAGSKLGTSQLGLLPNSFTGQFVNWGKDLTLLRILQASPMDEWVKNPCNEADKQEMEVGSWGQENSLAKEMATPSNILA